MASLQVEGSMLETSCGSPHYACPEVIRVISERRTCNYFKFSISNSGGKIRWSKGGRVELRCNSLRFVSRSFTLRRRQSSEFAGKGQKRYFPYSAFHSRRLSKPSSVNDRSGSEQANFSSRRFPTSLGGRLNEIGARIGASNGSSC